MLLVGLFGLDLGFWIVGTRHVVLRHLALVNICQVLLRVDKLILRLLDSFGLSRDPEFLWRRGN